MKFYRYHIFLFLTQIVHKLDNHIDSIILYKERAITNAIPLSKGHHHSDTVKISVSFSFVPRNAGSFCWCTAEVPWIAGFVAVSGDPGEIGEPGIRHPKCGSCGRHNGNPRSKAHEF